MLLYDMYIYIHIIDICYKYRYLIATVKYAEVLVGRKETFEAIFSIGSYRDILGITPAQDAL